MQQNPYNQTVLPETQMVLTFDKLVQETAQRLAPEHADITAAQVRDVLADVGIDDQIRDTIPAAQGRLIVHSITMLGQKMHAEAAQETFRYHRKLGSGLTAWVGSNGTGKSTILNCILWALTGSDSGVPKRLRPWIHDVLVEFSVGDSRFTSRVTHSNDRVSGGIYEGFVALDAIDLGAAHPVTLFGSRDEMREAIDMF